MNETLKNYFSPPGHLCLNSFHNTHITYTIITLTYRALWVGTLNGVQRTFCLFSLTTGAGAHLSILIHVDTEGSHADTSCCLAEGCWCHAPPLF